MQNNKLQTLWNSILACIKLIPILDDDIIDVWIISQGATVKKKTVAPTYSALICKKKVHIH